jgi:hypothetical protein
MYFTTNYPTLYIRNDQQYALICTIIIIFSSSEAQRGLWPPRHKRFLDHTQWRATSSNTRLGRVISSSQTSTWQHTQQTNIHAPGGIRTHDLSRREDLEGWGKEESLAVTGAAPASYFKRRRTFFHCHVFTQSLPGRCPSNIQSTLRTASGLYKNVSLAVLFGKGTGKAIPLQALTDPEGSRWLKLPNFIQSAHEGGKVVSPTHRPPLPPGNILGNHL